MGPFWSGAVTLWGGMVWGYLAMPESNFAPALGFMLCPVGALAGWASPKIAAHIAKRQGSREEKRGSHQCDVP